MADPVIKSFVQQYLQDYELEPRDDAADFELFANYCVFSSFNRTGEEFDVAKVHTGKPRDTGLDGIGVLIDDILVNSKEDAENVIGSNKKRTFKLKFIFVQAKLKNSFELPVVEKTVNAVEDFFADYKELEPLYSRSEQVNQKSLLASYLLKTYINNIREKPECNIYYISVSNIDAKSVIKKKQSILITEAEKKLGFLSRIEFHFWGSEKLEKLYRQTQLQVDAIVKVNRTFPLKVPRVKKAYMTSISFSEFKKIILHDDQSIRDFIFYDNVRGFLGEENNINEAIKGTLESDEDIALFPLLNNGVTIITQELKILDDDTYQLIDYQIVNGCQTSHVLNICKNFTNIDKTVIPVKLIETDDEEIRNKIIKATNSQTEVKKELLAALSDFNKKLEEYYEVQKSRHSKPLYYERRPGQFFNQNVIKTRIIRIQPQIKSFTAMFLDEPHNAKYLDKTLIDRIGKDIFSNSHYPDAYYASSWTFYQLNYLRKKSKFSIDFSEKGAFTKIKYYLLMLFKYLAIDDDCPSCKNKDIEKYCEILINVLDDTEKSEKIFFEAQKKLEDLAKTYNKQHNRQFSQVDEPESIDYDKICNLPAFTDFILSEMDVTNKNLSKERQRNLISRQGSLPI